MMQVEGQPRPTLVRPILLAERRWRHFRSGLREAGYQLLDEADSWFTIMTHPGHPAGDEYLLMLGNTDGRLWIDDRGVRHVADSPEELAVRTLDLLNDVKAIRPDQVAAAFPRRVGACTAPFWTDTHCPSGTPDTYDRALLRRHVERAAIGWLGYAPHNDDGDDLVIYRGNAVVYVKCYADAPVVKISTCVTDAIRDATAATEAVNDANNRQPFAKFMVRDEGIHVWTLIDAWEFSSLNFVRLLDHFLETIDEEFDALHRRAKIG